MLSAPAHPYTRALIDAVPTIGGGRSRLERVTSLGEATASTTVGGCNLRDRCPLRAALGSPEICETERPPLVIVESGHQAACHFADQILPAAVDPKEVAA